MTDRHTQTPEHRLGGLPRLSDAEVADLEAKNGLLQFDRMNELIAAIEGGGQFLLSPEHVRQLNLAAVDGLEATAGTYRTEPVKIGGTAHIPPPFQDVPRLVDEMCRYVNDLEDGDPLHLSAYTMWRLNWIHPFINGNGRTSRAVSYLVLCGKVGFRLPGKHTVPELISANKKPYYAALEAADAAFASGRIDVSAMEKLLGDLLTKQLETV